MAKQTSSGSRMATYKGKTYRVLFIGPTKYGRRAHLSFMDGSKDFWVDATLVTEGAASPGGSTQGTGGRVCGECGKGGALVADMEDGMLKHWRCCDMPPG